MNIGDNTWVTMISLSRLSIIFLLYNILHTKANTQHNILVKMTGLQQPDKCSLFLDNLEVSLDIGTSVRRSSGRRSGGRLLANDVVATIFISLFFPFFPFPPSRPFLIEGVVGSKNLFSESCLECPKI